MVGTLPTSCRAPRAPNNNGPPLRCANTNAVHLLLDELLHDAIFHIRNPKRLSCANQIANVLGIVQLAVHAGGQIQLTHG